LNAYGRRSIVHAPSSFERRYGDISATYQYEPLKKYGIIKHMRVVPPEEMKAREEEKKRKWEEKRVEESK
jgi:hypothetical protein